MVTFGFSAFLKLLSLNDKPRKTELRRRAGPSTGGYDFHSSFRRLAGRLVLEGAPLADMIAAAGSITKEPERLSTIAALERLAQWRAATPGAMSSCKPVVFQSPNKLFRVRFEPDFVLLLNGKRTAFHLWNTKRPALARGATCAALALAKAAYQGQPGAPDNVAVLSTREPATAYLLSEVAVPLATISAIVSQVEDGLRGGGPPPPVPPEDRPTPLEP